MDHEKTFVICDNLCLEPAYTKKQIDTINKRLKVAGNTVQETSEVTPDNPSAINVVTSPINLKLISDNIFNKNNVSFALNAKKDVLDTGVRITVNVAGQYKYVAIKLGGSELLGKKITIQTKITSSANNKGQLSLFYGTSTTLNSQYRIVDMNTTSPTTVSILDTFPNNFDTIWCCFYGNLTGTGNVGDYVDYTDVMIVIGDSIDDGYKPYQEVTKTLPITLPMTNKDYFTTENGWLQEKHVMRKIVLNDSETNLHMISSGLFRYDISDYNSQYILCNYFTNKIDDRIVTNQTANTYMGDNQISARVGDEKDRFYIKSSQFTTLDDFKTWLSTHNVEVWYELAEPMPFACFDDQTIPYLEIEDLVSNQGYTNIFCTDTVPANVEIVGESTNNTRIEQEKHFNKIDDRLWDLEFNKFYVIQKNITVLTGDTSGFTTFTLPAGLTSNTCVILGLQWRNSESEFIWNYDQRLAMNYYSNDNKANVVMALPEAATQDTTFNVRITLMRVDEDNVYTS